MNTQNNAAISIVLGCVLIVAGLIGLAVSRAIAFPLVSLVAGGALVFQGMVRRSR